jgi:hypothetical protein
MLLKLCDACTAGEKAIVSQVLKLPLACSIINLANAQGELFISFFIFSSFGFFLLGTISGMSLF